MVTMQGKGVGQLAAFDFTCRKSHDFENDRNFGTRTEVVGGTNLVGDHEF